jgi:hypothetical protein
MSDPVSHLKQELLSAAERQQRHTVLAPKSRRGWLERSRAVSGRRRRLVVVLAAVALATAVTTAGWAIVREVVHDESLVSLPPVGATPSAPESGELVIYYRLDVKQDIKPAHGRWRWVYADGRLLTADARPVAQQSHSDLPEADNRWSSGLLEQRLTPEGVELLRSEIVSTGLFEHDQTADDSSPHYSIHNEIQVRIGDRLIRVQGKFTANSNEFPKRLRERLADPASWLPASAWEDRRLRAYVPSRYAVSYGGLFQTTERSRILSLLPARAGDLLRDRDAVPRRRGYDGGGFTRTSLTYYVSDVTTEEARALVKALDDAGLKRDGGLGYSFEIPGTSVDPPPPLKGPVRPVVFIGFSPYFPHGETLCLACG